MPDDKKQSQNLGRALSLVVARAEHMDSAALLMELDQIEATFLPKVGYSRDLQLETKRRVAEWRFKLFSERNVSFGEAERLYLAVRELGYTDLETEATIEIYFARYCARQSRTDVAKRTLEELSDKLDRIARSKDLPVYQQLKREVQQALSFIK